MAGAGFCGTVRIGTKGIARTMPPWLLGPPDPGVGSLCQDRACGPTLAEDPDSVVRPDGRRYNQRMAKDEISHLDSQGRARMVDVSAKPVSVRWAVARGSVRMRPETLAAAQQGDLKKGDLRAAAELAGVMAAKRTSELIPLCHPLGLDQVEVRLEYAETVPGVTIEAIVRATGRTGVEMEALTAVAVAALTVYDMIKAIDRGARITDIRLAEKHGGQSGDVILER